MSGFGPVIPCPVGGNLIANCSNHASFRNLSGSVARMMEPTDGGISKHFRVGYMLHDL